MNAIIRGPIACIECHGKPGKGSEFDFGIQGFKKVWNLVKKMFLGLILAQKT